MYNNVGLRTARGTGTSGYVERSLAAPRGPAYSSSARAPYATSQDGTERPFPAVHAHTGPVGRSVLAHEARRGVELRCLELEDRLLAENVAVSDVQQRVASLRAELLRELETPEAERAEAMRAAKDAQMERLRVALGVREDAVEGAVFASFDRRSRPVPNAEGMIMPSALGQPSASSLNAQSDRNDTLPNRPPPLPRQ